MGTIATIYNPEYFTQDSFWKEIETTQLNPQWTGPSCSKLGLTGPVTHDRLLNVLKGFSPDGQTQFVRHAANGRERFGTEILLCAPNSFSALLATNPRNQWHAIFEVHEKARNQTLQSILTGQFEARRGPGGVERIPCTPAGVSLPNCYSRLGNPLIHDHAIVFKQAYCPDGQQTRTVLVDSLFQGQRQIRANYLLNLSNGCQHDLGLKIERKGHTFVIDGMPEKFLNELSPTRSEIGQYLVDRNLRDTSAAREIAAKVIRPEKNVYEASLLEVSWKTVAENHKVDVKISTVNQKDPEPGEVVRELQSYSLAAAASQDWTTQRQSFSKESFHLEVTRRAFGTGFTPEDIEKAVERVFQRPEAFNLKVLDRSPEGVIYRSGDVEKKMMGVNVNVKNDGNYYQNAEQQKPEAHVKKKPEQTSEQSKSKAKPEHNNSQKDANTKVEEKRKEQKQVNEPDSKTSKIETQASETKPSFLNSIQDRSQQMYENIRLKRPERVIEIDGAATPKSPNSLDRLIKDLKPTPLWKCHAKAYNTAWGKWFDNGSQMMNLCHIDIQTRTQA